MSPSLHPSASSRLSHILSDVALSLTAAALALLPTALRSALAPLDCSLTPSSSEATLSTLALVDARTALAVPALSWGLSSYFLI